MPVKRKRVLVGVGILVALAVEGVREVRADLPVDLQREMAADR